MVAAVAAASTPGEATTWLLALGSRGDVQPMAVLARRLTDRGHRAVVIALHDAKQVCAELGAEFVGVDGSVDDALVSARGPIGQVLSRGSVGQAALLVHWVRQLAGPVSEVLGRCVRPGDAVVTGVLGRSAALALVEARHTRMATVVFTGQVPTLRPSSHYFDEWFTPSRAWNRMGVRLNWLVASELGHPIGVRLRSRLGLGRVSPRAEMHRADRWPTLVAASPVLVPPADDWPDGVVQTGWLGAPARDWAPDGELAGFLAEGPVAWVGWGSFSAASREADVKLVAQAAALSGVRVLTPELIGLAQGRVSDEMLAVGPVPHSSLFGRLDAVIHHGGAGTTQEGLRAGVPSMAVPFGVDQPWHARRLHALGVGPAPVPIRRLDADTLARRLEALVGTASYRERAALIGARMRDERGPDAAVDALTRARVVL